MVRTAISKRLRKMTLRSETRREVANLAHKIAALFEREILASLERLSEMEQDFRSSVEQLAVPMEFDVHSAARYLGMSSTTLRRRAASREIAYRREGVKLLFTRAALDEYRNSTTRPTRISRLPGF